MPCLDDFVIYIHTHRNPHVELLGTKTSRPRLIPYFRTLSRRHEDGIQQTQGQARGRRSRCSVGDRQRDYRIVKEIKSQELFTPGASAVRALDDEQQQLDVDQDRQAGKYLSVLDFRGTLKLTARRPIQTRSLQR